MFLTSSIAQRTGAFRRQILGQTVNCATKSPDTGATHFIGSTLHAVGVTKPSHSDLSVGPLHHHLRQDESHHGMMVQPAARCLQILVIHINMHLIRILRCRMVMKRLKATSNPTPALHHRSSYGLNDPIARGWIIGRGTTLPTRMRV